MASGQADVGGAATPRAGNLDLGVARLQELFGRLDREWTERMGLLDRAIPMDRLGSGGAVVAGDGAGMARGGSLVSGSPSADSWSAPLGGNASANEAEAGSLTELLRENIRRLETLGNGPGTVGTPGGGVGEGEAISGLGESGGMGAVVGGAEGEVSASAGVEEASPEPTTRDTLDELDSQGGTARTDAITGSAWGTERFGGASFTAGVADRASDALSAVQAMDAMNIGGASRPFSGQGLFGSRGATSAVAESGIAGEFRTNETVAGHAPGAGLQGITDRSGLISLPFVYRSKDRSVPDNSVWTTLPAHPQTQPAKAQPLRLERRPHPPERAGSASSRKASTPHDVGTLLEEQLSRWLPRVAAQPGAVGSFDVSAPSIPVWDDAASLQRAYEGLSGPLVPVPALGDAPWSSDESQGVSQVESSPDEQMRLLKGLDEAMSQVQGDVQRLLARSPRALFG